MWSAEGFTKRRVVEQVTQAPGQISWVDDSHVAADFGEDRCLFRDDGTLVRRFPAARANPSGTFTYQLGRITEYCAGTSYTRDGDELQEWRSTDEPNVVSMVGPRGNEQVRHLGHAFFEKQLHCASWLNDNELVIAATTGLYVVRADSIAQDHRSLDWGEDPPTELVVSPKAKSSIFSTKSGKIGLVTSAGVLYPELGLFRTRQSLITDSGHVVYYTRGGVWRFSSEDRIVKQLLHSFWKGISGITLSSNQRGVHVVRSNGTTTTINI